MFIKINFSNSRFSSAFELTCIVSQLVAPGRKEIEDQLSAVLQARAQQQVRPRVRVTEDPDEDMQRTVELTSASLTSTALAPIAEPMAIEVDDD